MEGVSTADERVLTDEDLQRLAAQDDSLVSDFKRNKLEVEARKNWDLFYKRNETRFFRDRHWTTREFEQLLGPTMKGTAKSLLEVGCGVGNFFFPLVEEDKALFVYACDFSSRAVELIKKDARYDEGRIRVFTCDITRER